VGEELDKKGIHRIHALGISVSNKAVLIILPMGGGKTTLGLELLKYDDVTLLSDDTPLITKDGQVLPFPIRIGVCKEAASKLDIPSRYLRNFNRSKYGPKILIDIDYFKDKISDPCKLAVVFIGERLFSSDCQIGRIPKYKISRVLIINGVLGLGLPQLLEFAFTPGRKKIMRFFFSRFGLFLKLLKKIEGNLLLIGREPSVNASILYRYLKNI
jgi:hypothetical protein